MGFAKDFDDVLKEFTVDAERLHIVAADFRYDLRLGLAGRDDSSLAMLPSYLALPTGRETGEYLAVDFGGTNVRVLRYHLLGDGKYEMLKKAAKPLAGDGYDYTAADATAEQLFGLIADLVYDVLDGDTDARIRLGHTFSFATEQSSLADAKLLGWSKEIAVPGVVGENVNALLKQALAQKGLKKVEPVAILNDTVATLLAASYELGNTSLAAIYATGFNACYLESYKDSAKEPMILNLEAGGFVKVVPSRYDIALDDASERPGEQRLEKMVSGRYLGTLFDLALADLFGETKRYGFTAADLSIIAADEANDLFAVTSLIDVKAGHRLSREEAHAVQELAGAIVIRSARLVAAALVAVLWQLQGTGEMIRQTIAIDGTVYDKMPLVKENLTRALYELLGEDAANVETKLVTGGSGLGAALAAAMAK